MLVEDWISVSMFLAMQYTCLFLSESDVVYISVPTVGTRPGPSATVPPDFGLSSTYHVIVAWGSIEFVVQVKVKISPDTTAALAGLTSRVTVETGTKT